jgi:hypothetical protein
MIAVPIEVENGLLRLPPEFVPPPKARLAVLLIEPRDAADGDSEDLDLMKVAEVSGAFDFLEQEPDLYTEADIPPDRLNPEFGRK